MKQEIQNKIDELKAQINELEAELKKPEKWQPKGGDWLIDKNGDVQDDVFFTEQSRLFGMQKSTKELAEHAAKAMRAFNRLLAYRDEFFPEWEEYTGELFYVSRITPLNWDLYVAGVGKSHFDGRVLFSHSVAKELVRKLNSGEVEL